MAMQGRLQARLARHLQRESGLSGADYEVLASLSESPTGRLRAFELGKTTDWEKSRVSHHLTRMAQRGLVERQVCAGDSRYADIVLTDAGRAAIEEAAPLHVAHVRDWFIEALTPEQLQALGEACEVILAKLDAAPDDPCSAVERSCAPDDVPLCEAD